MRDGSHYWVGRRPLFKAARSLTLAVATCWGIGQTSARADAPYYPAPTAPTSGVPGLDDLQARLELQQNEIQQLHAQLTGLQAKTVSADMANAEAAPCDGDCKEVPIIEKPTCEIHGKFFWDDGSCAQTPANLVATGKNAEKNWTGFSLIRLQAKGWVYENVDYSVEMEFAGTFNGIVDSGTLTNPASNPTLANQWVSQIDQVQFKDIYSTIRYMPVIGNVRVGFFKEPFLLEELTGDENTTFMRRALTDNLAPARRWGMMAFNNVNENPYMSWYAGIFRYGFTAAGEANTGDYPIGVSGSSGAGTLPFERSNLDDWNYVSRFVWLPYYDESTNGRSLLHVGVDYLHAGVDPKNGGTAAFSSTPEATTLNSFCGTGNVNNANSLDQYDLEGSVKWGPLTITSEMCWANLNLNNGNVATIPSAYVEASYFLTRGDSRSYDLEGKRWSRTTPVEPFFWVRDEDTCCCCKGMGALEIAARYSYIDYNAVLKNGTTFAGSAGAGGDMQDTTLGVNWYLNGYTRVMFNYVHSDLTEHGRADTLANIYETRFQLEF